MKKAIGLVFVFFLSSFIWAQELFNVNDFRMLEDSLLKIMESNHIPGAQFCITDPDTTLWIGNLGLADVNRNIPVDSATMFRIGSISKSFVAVSVIMLAERGLIDLNDKVRDLVPEVVFYNSWEDTDPVRIVNLLEHTAGWDDIHISEYVIDAKGWTLAEGLQYHPQSRTSRWKPGTHMSYCNSGPAVAAYAVERITGTMFEEFVDENIFSPLGMVNSSYFNDPYVQDHLSKGYVGESLNEAPYWNIIMRPSGAVNSNASEMAAYIRLFLKRGMANTIKLLDTTSVSRIEHPESTLAARFGIPVGYGLNISGKIFKGVKVYSHGGGLDGFHAMMGYIPALRTGYAVFVNQSGTGGFSAINRMILNFLIPDSLMKTAEDFTMQDVTINPDIFGYYRSATSRSQIGRFAQRIFDIARVYEKDGSVFYQPLFESEELIYPFSDNAFLNEKSNGDFSPFVFVPDGNGNLFLQQTSFSANYVKTTGFCAWLEIIVSGLSILLMLSCVVAALIWIPVALIRKRKPRFLAARVMPLLTVLFFCMLFLTFSLGSMDNMLEKLNGLTIYTFGIFLFSLLFGLFTFVSLYIGILSFRKQMNRHARVYNLLVSVACVTVATYLWYWGWIGIRLWV